MIDKIAGIDVNAVGEFVENRLVGMKSHGVYETPAGTILHSAHRVLESLVLDRDTMHFKEMLSPKYAELVYNGAWFTPLRTALDAFVESTQQNMSGTVRLKLYKGNCIIAGCKSPFSLYREELATFGKEDVYDQGDAKGFINLYGLPLKVRSLVQLDWGKKPEYPEPDYSKFKRD